MCSFFDSSLLAAPPMSRQRPLQANPIRNSGFLAEGLNKPRNYAIVEAVGDFMGLAVWLLLAAGALDAEWCVGWFVVEFFVSQVRGFTRWL